MYMHYNLEYIYIYMHVHANIKKNYIYILNTTGGSLYMCWWFSAVENLKPWKTALQILKSPFPYQLPLLQGPLSLFRMHGHPGFPYLMQNRLHIYIYMIYIM